MDLMNKDLPLWTREVTLNSAPAFKQDPKLAAAIDKIHGGHKRTASNLGNLASVVLPERKLDFAEVQRLLKQTTEFKQVTEKSPDVLVKEANEARKGLIKKIEDILNEINRSAEAGDIPKLTIRNQRLWSNCIYDLDRVTLKSGNDAKKTTVTYNSRDDRTRFNTIVFVLTKVHELLTKNLTITRRELFYQNVVRLRNQANLDVAVRDVCCLLETPPWSLGVVATAKGLIAGPLTMHSRDGNVVDCMTSGGTLIPQDINGIKEFRSSAKYILVVEKDAIFQKLLDEGALIRLGPVIILTGKGYPDVCTRQLLCRLCSELRLRALALVDADPHGMEIFLTYKYGSLAQSHLSSSLACASLSLLGARHRDVMTLAPTEARLKLTELDKRKINSVMKRPYLASATGTKIKEELQLMLSSGVKAEIEALAPTAAALCDAYLPAKLIHGEYLAILTSMEDKTQTVVDKKGMNKAKSVDRGAAPSPAHFRGESTKRKSYSLNEAVKSLDLTFSQLKKSKRVPHEGIKNTDTKVPTLLEPANISIDMSSSSGMTSEAADSSQMSMEFSHYELVRNLSRFTIGSDGGGSGHTCYTGTSRGTCTDKDDFLEKYFRSIDDWNKTHRKRH